MTQTSHLIFLADQCWAFGCTRPAYVALVEEKGHTFRCRQCAVEHYGEKWIVAGEQLRDRARTQEHDA